MVAVQYLVIKGIDRLIANNAVVWRQKSITGLVLVRTVSCFQLENVLLNEVNLATIMTPVVGHKRIGRPPIVHFVSGLTFELKQGDVLLVHIFTVSLGLSIHALLSETQEVEVGGALLSAGLL